MLREKWYKEGLRFTCTECGSCCTGAPGYVWVSQEEIKIIADRLGREDGWLPPEILRRVGFRYSLSEKSNGDCFFLQSDGEGRRRCSIYDIRPLQCRTWPFWTSNLKTPRDWAEASENCPGMNNGQTHTYVQIETKRTQKSW
jgi:Fe-S-cluster containining protein